MPQQNSHPVDKKYQLYREKISKIELVDQRNNRALRVSQNVGKYLRYPISESRRICEGGQRLLGNFKSIDSTLPLVTIITVCRNSEKTIQQTFDSVRNQSYSHIEYIVIDACSVDNTLQIIRENEDLIDYYLSEEELITRVFEA